MQTISVYRYTRPDGGVSVSPVKPEGEYTELYRLVADEGMVLTDGENYAACTDTETPDAWSEVVDEENGESATEEGISDKERIAELEEALEMFFSGVTE